MIAIVPASEPRYCQRPFATGQLVIAEQGLHGGDFRMDTHTQLSFEIFRREIVGCNELKKVQETAVEVLSLYMRQQEMVAQWIKEGKLTL